MLRLQPPLQVRQSPARAPQKLEGWALAWPRRWQQERQERRWSLRRSQGQQPSLGRDPCRSVQSLQPAAAPLGRQPAPASAIRVAVLAAVASARRPAHTQHRERSSGTVIEAVKPCPRLVAGRTRARVRQEGWREGSSALAGAAAMRTTQGQPYRPSWATIDRASETAAIAPDEGAATW